jgi:hypothetical protein
MFIVHLASIERNERGEREQREGRERDYKLVVRGQKEERERGR